MGKIIDLSGKRYGSLLVKAIAGKQNGRIQWNCVCDCGKEVIVRGNSLQSGNTASCGCLKIARTRGARFKDISGQRFGRLLVLECEGRIGNSCNWLCLCDCGKKLVVNGCNLATGGSTSCGCLRREKTTKHGLCGKGWKEYRDYLWKQDPSRKLRHHVSNAARRAMSGNKGGRSFFDHVPYTVEELRSHLESLWEPWMNWDNYGGRMNDPRKTWHIDHIVPHNDFKYSSMTDKEFIECWALSNLRPLEKIENRNKWYH